MKEFELGRGSFQGINDFTTMLRGLQVNEDLDALIGVSGFKGFGKSSFGKQVMRRYLKKYKNEDLTPKNLEKYTAYVEDDVFRLMDELPDYSPLDADEAVNFAMGEDWMKSGSKKLKKVFAKIRNKHFIFFFNIPDLWWLDKKYREGMMTVWVHIVKKGHVMISFPNTAPGIEDRWYRDWLEKAFTKNPINYFTPIDVIMRKLRKYPCYFDEFDFPKLPEKLYQKHLELRNAKTMIDGQREEAEKEKDKELKLTWKLQPLWIKRDWENFKKLYTKVMDNGGEFTNDDIASFFYRDFKTKKPLIGHPNIVSNWISELGISEHRKAPDDFD